MHAGLGLRPRPHNDSTYGGCGSGSKGVPDRFFELFGLQGIVLPDTDQFCFQRFTGRQIGQVDETSHYRSGDPDGWLNELPSLVIDYRREEFRPSREGSITMS
jgi:hypothetical protein